MRSVVSFKGSAILFFIAYLAFSHLKSCLEISDILIMITQYMQESGRRKRLGIKCPFLLGGLSLHLNHLIG